MKSTESIWNVCFSDQYDGTKSEVKGNLTKDEAIEITKELCEKYPEEDYFCKKEFGLTKIISFRKGEITIQ
jgi:enolase